MVTPKTRGSARKSGGVPPPRQGNDTPAHERKAACAPGAFCRAKEKNGGPPLPVGMTPPVPDYFGAPLAARAFEIGSAADGGEAGACVTGVTTMPVTSPLMASFLRLPTVPRAARVARLLTLAAAICSPDNSLRALGGSKPKSARVSGDDRIGQALKQPHQRCLRERDIPDRQRPVREVLFRAGDDRQHARQGRRLGDFRRRARHDTILASEALTTRGPNWTTHG